MHFFLKSDYQPRRCHLFFFLILALAAILFSVCSGTILAILVKENKRKSFEINLKSDHWPRKICHLSVLDEVL